MNRRALAAAFSLGLAYPLALSATSFTSMAAIHQLSNAQAAAHVPADFDATVVFYRSYESTLFVQDGDTAIFVQPDRPYTLAPGDRIHVHGVTHESFRPFVSNASLTLLRHGARPPAPPASFDDLIHARLDCRYVRVRGRILSADITLSSDRPSTTLQMLMDGGPVEVQVESNNPEALPQLLDAEVDVTGAVSGRFDGKMEMTGVVLHTQNLADVTVVMPQRTTPWSAPLTPMNEILADFRASNQSRRVRVQGTVTYFMPGSAVVLQNGSRSLWINARTLNGVQIGDQADATGFPDVRDGFLRIDNGELMDSHRAAPVQPVEVSWRDLTQSHHVFDLVSISANVVAEVREQAQDEYVLVSDGHLFSAIYRHPGHSSDDAAAEPALKQIPLGARVKVTGVCILEDSNPFNVDVPFDLLMRSFDDIAVVARPSPVNVANLVKAIGVLVVLVVAMFAWGWMLKRKVEQQTRVLAGRVEAEAAMERLNAQIEQRRGGILEDINGARPLAEILEEITDLVSFRLQGAPCWCEVSGGATLGQLVSNAFGRRIVREEIPARSGAPLGYLCAAVDAGVKRGPEEEQAFFQGTRLATLAIETRRAYSELVHRSEFDLLTDVHNRFSLEKLLEALIVCAREQAAVFGLVYIDLDQFKGVNDNYGHHVGDLYLQEVCVRMKRQLRGGDVLARIGGDEFAAVIPSARTHAGMEEIAKRLERCFDEPFRLQGYTLRGSASVGIALYPADGTTRDSLLTAADSAMYARKHDGRIVQ